MASFPHLKLSKKIDGSHRPRRQGGPRETNPITQKNLEDRRGHGTALLGSLDNLSNYWSKNLSTRSRNNLPDLPNSTTVPVFLRIDSDEFDVESLKSFGIEIIAEGEDGFIIGASGDNFTSLRAKIEKFIQEQGRTKKASQLWEINDGTQWRVDQILSDDLKAKWGSITDDDIFIVDIGIACYLRISDQPGQESDESNEDFLERLNRWKEKKLKTETERDELAIKRENEFETLVAQYNGESLSGYVDFGDSFSCRIKISGKGLKDIVLNYQYLFEVVEAESFVQQDSSVTEVIAVNPDLLPPSENSPKVCVVDSGIQEGHRLLSPAIDTLKSKSFIPGDASTADTGTNGGHGTRVAGAVLYPGGIPKSGQYSLPFFIQNARVLDSSHALPETLYPPQLMEDVVNHFDPTRIFNMSINTFNACQLLHMSQWAAMIDKLMFSKDILFILSAGNVRSSDVRQGKPGIKEHLSANRNYPTFLLEKACRIGNPAQSCFALTVGSVCLGEFDDGIKESFGKKDDPSSFSRTGLGLWQMIKPDVVEYGGDFVKEKNTTPNISNENSISPELVRSTLVGG